MIIALVIIFPKKKTLPFNVTVWQHCALALYPESWQAFVARYRHSKDLFKWIKIRYFRFATDHLLVTNIKEMNDESLFLILYLNKLQSTSRDAYTLFIICDSDKAKANLVWEVESELIRELALVSVVELEVSWNKKARLAGV